LDRDNLSDFSVVQFWNINGDKEEIAAYYTDTSFEYPDVDQIISFDLLRKDEEEEAEEDEENKREYRVVEKKFKFVLVEWEDDENGEVDSLVNNIDIYVEGPLDNKEE